METMEEATGSGQDDQAARRDARRATGAAGATRAAPDPQPPAELLAAPMSAAGVAARVRQALDDGDLEQFAALLSPDVHWGAPGDPNPPCRNRRQVLDWYARGRAAGRRASVTDVEVHGNAVLVGLVLDDGGHPRWQVLRVGPDGVNDIRGFDDRTSALAGLAL